jgi:N-acetylated-alpha-linked acidic dipeptidase
VVCSWDGEEYALTGSTEWGEQYADELKKKAVAYINVDEATSGKNFEGDAVASLAPLLLDVTRTLPTPSGKTLYEEWRNSRQIELQEKNSVADGRLVNTRIGSGSDHTVFLNFLGIPTVGLTFAGPYGVYHSAYDDFYWMNQFGDPGYKYHTLMAQLWGVMALRLANAGVLPFDFESYGANIGQFVTDLEGTSHVDGHVDLAPLQQRVADFQTAGRELNSSIDRAITNGKLDAQAASRIDRAMMRVERNWLNPNGIPGRPWFKHALYAARYTYAHLELPGLTEAAEAGDWKRAEEQAKILEDQIDKNTELLREIKRELDSTRGAATP